MGGWTIDQSISASPHLVPVLLEPAILQQVQDAAAAHGVTAASWLREAMRQVTLEDFPASWRAGSEPIRTHESGYFARKFMLRLDQGTSTKLEVLTQRFNRSAAEVIRQLIARAKWEDFPQSWHLALGEHRQERDA